MRSSLAVTLFAVCLGLAGCKLFDGRTPSPSSAPPSSSTPFKGAEGGSDRGSGGDSRSVQGDLTGTSSLPQDVNGFLAGRILGRYNPTSATVYIQVVEAKDAHKGGARLWKRVKDGYFKIQDLKADREYLLTVVVKDGERTLSAQKKAFPPDPRWWVEVQEGPLPAGVVPPGSTATLPAGEKARPTSVPAATLDAPVRGPNDTRIFGGAVPPPPSSDGLNGSAERIGKNVPGEPRNGFTKVPESPNVNIPNPGPGREIPPPPEGPTRYTPLPPPPSATGLGVPALSVPGASTAPSAAPRPGLSVAPPPEWRPSPLDRPAPSLPKVNSPAPAPSCRVVGRKVENFALYGLDGQAWELRRHRRGRLVLLDFWYTTCGPCLNAVGHLGELQQTYGSYGLQVVGVAYEKGRAAEQVRRVNAARERFNINYTTLLGGGGTGPCPVKTQFGVKVFPTLVLIDETGQIVWRSEGLDEAKLYQLKVEIYRRLSQPLAAR